MARTPRRKTADTSSSTASTAAAGAPKGGDRKDLAKGKRNRESAEGDDDANKVKKMYDWRKYRKKCSTDGCKNYEVNGGVCKKHGAVVTRKLCSVERCTNIAQKGGVCIKHGAKVKQCSRDGCTKHVQNGGLCIKHGAKVKRCSHDGCTKQVKNGGLCVKHGAEVKRCSSEGCTTYARPGFEVCIKHGAKVKLCSSEGCNNKAIKGGKCWTHGGKPPKCSSSGCQNYSDRKGVCIRHGARVKECKSEGCSYLAWRGGFCYRHREDRLTATEVITEGDAESVPALPPIDLTALPPVETGPNEDAELESSEDCDLCYVRYNVDDLVKCASDSACTKSICHDCLIRNFLRPWKVDGGRLTNYDPTNCPYCLTEGAFSLDETDAAIVEREVATMYSEMHTFEEATEGASYASTNHEQGDEEYFPSGEEDDDE